MNLGKSCSLGGFGYGTLFSVCSNLYINNYLVIEYTRTKFFQIVKNRFFKVFSWDSNNFCIMLISKNLLQVSKKIFHMFFSIYS